MSIHQFPTANTQPESPLFFPVSETQFTVPCADGEPANSDSFKAIVRDDSRQVLAVHGADYKLIPNKELFGLYHDAILSAGLNRTDMTVQDALSHNGAKAYREYIFPAHQVQIGTTNDGSPDLVNLKITAANSYDGSTAFRSLVGGFRLICSNGMVIGVTLQNVYGRHTQGLDIEYQVRKINTALDIYLKQAKDWTLWRETTISDSTAESVFKSFPNSNDRLVKLLIEQYQAYVAEIGHNYWAIYNTLTWYSTHAKRRNLDNSAATTAMREDSVRRVIQHFPIAA